MIDASTELFGVTGYPVRHSLSPVFQNALIKWAGLNAVYLAFEVPPEELPAFVRFAKVNPVRGFNVTVPHKETIVPLLDGLDETARRIGAVNTVKVENGKAYGYNTDWIGFLKSARGLLGRPLKGVKVLVLGAGGVAKAILYALTREGAEVLLWNRTREKALALAQKFPVRLVGSPEEGLKEAELVVNATSLGLKKDDPPIFDYALLRPGQAVFDAVYGDTPLVREALRRGLKAADGLSMLLWQGIESFFIWNGCRPPYETARRAVEEYLAWRKRGS
ncbi:MAG: shikimate dehydrogenase [Aquificae bacterium]|nr:shikimate dehydrogenase [Aquificota bacterium]